MKNIRNFVSAASLLLAIWLGLTFVSEVPANSYPSLGKGSVRTTAKEKKVGAPFSAAVENGRKGLATVPLSR